MIIPKLKSDKDNEEGATDFTSLLADRLNNDSKEAKNIKKFLEEMRERLGEKKSMKFVMLF